jgi:hypothetical protein
MRPTTDALAGRPHEPLVRWEWNDDDLDEIVIGCRLR